MNEKKKIIIIGASVIIIGVAAFAIYKVRKNRKNNVNQPDGNLDVSQPSNVTQPNVPSASPVMAAPAGVIIRDFQAFARGLGFKNVAGRNKGQLITVDGDWGTNTAAAWVKHGAAYVVKPKPAGTTSGNSAGANSDDTPPATNTTKPSYNKDAFNRLAGRLHRSMQGAGTTSDFWVVMSYLKNQADYDALKAAFGIREGANMYKWIEGDIRDGFERLDYNAMMKKKNIKSFLTV